MPKVNKPDPQFGPGYRDHPDHKILLDRHSGGITVKIRGNLVAESYHAILLTETGYSPVYYLPRSDVNFAVLDTVDLSTYCPFKGYARYWRLAADDDGEPIAWGYDEPYSEVSKLLGYVAFYDDRVTIEAKKLPDYK